MRLSAKLHEKPSVRPLSLSLSAGPLTQAEPWRVVRLNRDRRYRQDRFITDARDVEGLYQPREHQHSFGQRKLGTDADAWTRPEGQISEPVRYRCTGEEP
jgi:hypothetical protein